MKLRDFNQKVWKRIAIFVLGRMGIGAGAGVESSGERNSLNYLMKSIFSTFSPVIFDVGANIGDYAISVLERIPDVKLYCFEPSLKTYELLCGNLAETFDRHVVLENCGISNENSNAVLYSNKVGSGLASLFERNLDHYEIVMDQKETVHLRTLDSYCAEKGIEEIDLLKMDIEGNELRALEGAKGLLKKRAIHAIQIEFGGCNVDSKSYFKDFWYLLHENYYVYRILEKGLYEITHYDDFLEIFLCTNYLFVRKENV